MTFERVCWNSTEQEKGRVLWFVSKWETHNEKERAIGVQDWKSIFGLRLYSNRIISIVHSSSFIFVKESYQ